jgi:hypothetical protein
MWEIDGVANKNDFSDSFMYNDSGNESVNIRHFVRNFLETLENNITGDFRKLINFEDLINFAVSAYKTGEMSTSSAWGEMHLRRVTEWSQL